MDDIKRNNSDSDLSDDWNVIDPKDAPPISESESIEVLEEEDDSEDEDADREDPKETKNSGHNTVDINNVGELETFSNSKVPGTKQF